MQEVWKDIPEYEGLYQVSNLGRVKSLLRYVLRRNGQTTRVNETILKQTLDTDGYPIVGLCKNNRKTQTVHRLVAKAFIPNPENKPCIDHIDGNRTNNNVDNLRWATVKENANNPISKKRYRNMAIKLKHYKSKQKAVLQIKDGKIINEFESMREAERKTGISHAAISSVILNKSSQAGGFYWELSLRM